MTNKIWIVLLTFSTLVFAILAIALPISMLTDHKPVWRAVGGSVLMCIITLRCIDLLRSHLKHSPKGPPTGPGQIPEVGPEN